MFFSARPAGFNCYPSHNGWSRRQSSIDGLPTMGSLPAFWLEFGGNNTQSQSVRATAQRAHLAFALRKRQIKAHGSHLLQILIRVSILSPVTQPARVRQLAKRARTGWCRRSRQLVRAPPEVPQIFAEPLAWHVLHQRIERHDVLSLGMRTVIMTVGMARDHCVLDSTLVPFWLAQWTAILPG